MSTQTAVYKSDKYHLSHDERIAPQLQTSTNTFTDFGSSSKKVNPSKAPQKSSSNQTDSEDDDDDKQNVLVPSSASPPAQDSTAQNSHDQVAATKHDPHSELLRDEEYSTVIWTGPGHRTPLVLFSPDSVMRKDAVARMAGERYHLTFKIVRTDCKLVRTILQTFGFHETHANSPDYNLMWTGSHLKPYVLRGMTEFQKVNHFPRSYEITRKDRMFKNIQRLQQIKGTKFFDFVPTTYVLPGEFQDFCAAFVKDKGPYIVKPVASSRGRGIFLCTHPDSVALDENYVVTKYIQNPYLIDGFKFDLRIYVAVTSFDPLVIYMYEEGLARFATVKYQLHGRSLKNQCMHLTNYSVNKRSNDFVQNDDADVEDFGNKWSLGALLRYLQAEGVDIAALIMRIEDVVVKALISVEVTVGTACKMFQPYRGNCYELFGFDIILDEHLRPWLLEVNLSPSLACDSPLDFKVKNSMLCDLFTLVGVVCHDPILKTTATHRHAKKFAPGEETIRSSNKNNKSRNPPTSPSKLFRPNSASGSSNFSNSAGSSVNHLSTVNTPLAMDEARMVRWFKEEHARRGGWIRLHPSRHSWEQYSAFLQSSSTHNLLLHQKLFSHLWPQGSSTASSTAPVSHKGKVPLHSISTSALALALDPSSDHYGRISAAYEAAQEHLRYFCRKLGQQPLSARTTMLHYRRSPSPTFTTKRESSSQERSPLHDSSLSKSFSVADGLMRSKSQVNAHTHNIFRGNLVKPVLDREESHSAVDLKSDPLSKSVEPTSEDQSTSGDRRVSKKKPAVEAKHSDDSQSEPHSDDDGGSSVCTTEHDESDTSSSRDRTPHVGAPRPETVERTSLQALIALGEDMNRFQARTAFSAYLSRVQKRFIHESRAATSGEEEADDVKTSEEQMELVLRFLRHASSHLSQSLRVSAPSKRLPMHQKKRILAQTLSVFVRHYDKETDNMRHKLTTAVSKGMSYEDFKRVIHEGTENDLELFLTVYTKKHKSAGIFIDGGKEETSHVADFSNPQPPQRVTRNHSSFEPPETMPSSAAHLRQIALIYGRGVSDRPLMGRRRPLSATLPQRPPTAALYEVEASPAAPTKPFTISRPSSGVLRGKHQNASGQQGPQVDTFDENAINIALQKMAQKQQARQYTANGSIPTTLVSSPKSFKIRPHSAERRFELTSKDQETPPEGTEMVRPIHISFTSPGQIGSDGHHHGTSSTVTSHQLLDQFRRSKQLLDVSLKRGPPQSTESSGALNPRPPQGPKPPPLSKKMTGLANLSRFAHNVPSNVHPSTSSSTVVLQKDPFWTQ